MHAGAGGEAEGRRRRRKRDGGRLERKPSGFGVDRRAKSAARRRPFVRARVAGAWDDLDGTPQWREDREVGRSGRGRVDAVDPVDVATRQLRRAIEAQIAREEREASERRGRDGGREGPTRVIPLTPVEVPGRAAPSPVLVPRRLAASRGRKFGLGTKR